MGMKRDGETRRAMTCSREESMWQMCLIAIRRDLALKEIYWEFFIVVITRSDHQLGRRFKHLAGCFSRSIRKEV